MMTGAQIYERLVGNQTPKEFMQNNRNRNNVHEAVDEYCDWIEQGGLDGIPTRISREKRDRMVNYIEENKE